MSVLPQGRARRRVIAAAVVLAVMVVLWFWVFPWVDRTYVNRPAVEQSFGAARIARV